MADYFSNLILRMQGRAAVVQPRLAPLFAAGPPLASPGGEEAGRPAQGEPGAGIPSAETSPLEGGIPAGYRREPDVEQPRFYPEPSEARHLDAPGWPTAQAGSLGSSHLPLETRWNPAQPAPSGSRETAGTRPADAQLLAGRDASPGASLAPAPLSRQPSLFKSTSPGLRQPDAGFPSGSPTEAGLAGANLPGEGPGTGQPASSAGGTGKVPPRRLLPPVPPEDQSEGGSPTPAQGSRRERWSPAASPPPPGVQAAGSQPAPAPVIQVSIGRVEVRANLPAPPLKAPAPVSSGPRMSLDEYLLAQKGGKR